MERDQRQILTEYLVHRIQSGDSDAFRQLYDLWNSELIRYASVRIKNSGAVADVMQEVWLSITKGLRRLKDPACFPRWAFQIVSRRSVDWIRKEQRNRKNQHLFEENIDSIHPPENTKTVSHTESNESLRGILTTLPDNQREILHLFYLSELNLKEISAILGIPKGTVKSRLFHAREAMRKVMDKK